MSLNYWCSLSKIKSILIFCVLSVISSNSLAQNIIEGKVVDDQGKPITDFNVIFINPKDSSVVFGKSFSSEKFEIDSRTLSNYLLKISCIGYKETIIQKPNNAKDSRIDLGIIVLSPALYSIDDVQVKAKVPRLLMQQDKLVYNVENTTISNAGTALDLLMRTPYITTDNSDIISIAGRGNTLVLVNGKRIRSNSELRLLNSSQIKKVELIENPSAKYEAEGHGVINIITVRNQTQGLYSSVFLSYKQGKKGTGFVSAEISYKMKKIEFFGNLSYEKYGSQGLNETWIKYEKNSYLFKSYTYDLKRYTKANNYSYNFGANYNINRKHSFGIQCDGYNNNGGTNTISNMDIEKNSATIPTQQSFIDDTNKPSRNTVGINYNYKDSTGNEFSAISDFTKYEIDNRSNIVETNVSSTYLGRMKSYSASDYNLFTVKFDALIPLNTLAQKLELGSKYSLVNSDNSTIFQRQSNSQWEIDSMFSNAVDYTEQILGIYALYTGEYKNWQYSAGLRGEYIMVENTTIGKTKINDSYTKLFPNLSIVYKFNKNINCRFIYSRRISRPSYSSLNNSLLYIDSLSTRQGNPFLKPTIYNTFSFNLSNSKKITIGATYSYIENPRDMLFINDKINIERYTVIFQNVKNTWSLGSNISGSFSYRAWNAQPMISFTYSPIVIIDDGIEYEFRNPMYSASCNNQISLPKSLNLEIGILYQQPAYSFKKFGKQINLDLGCTKKFFQNKMVISISYHEEFKPWTQKYDYSYKYCYVEWNGNSRRSFNVSFRYYMTGKNISTKRKSSNEEEIKRL